MTKTRRRLTPAERKAEILTAARSLFTQRGISAVSVSQIIAYAGISKGGFYHHFDTKETLVSEVVSDFAEQVLDAALASLLQRGTALERLNRFFAKAVSTKAKAAQDLEIAQEAMAMPNSDELLIKTRARIAPQIRAAFVDLINAGTSEGAFKPVDANIVADCFLGFEQGRLATFERAKTLAEPDAIELMFQRTRLEARTLDRLLGLPDGSITFGTESELNAIMSAVRMPKP